MVLSKQLDIGHIKDLLSPIINLNWVQGLVIQNNQVGFILDVPQEMARSLPQFRDMAENAIKCAYPGINVRIVTTTHVPKKPSVAVSGKISLPTIKRIIAIASGKGGVGKSTIALSIAQQLSQQGQAVGLLDLDIFGPSLPTLLGHLPPPPTDENKKMLPHKINNLTVQSIGYMVDPEKAVIWRGPMVMGAVEQLFRDTKWPELDILVLDLPPGTGDVQLTLAQKIPLNGAIIVTTPHQLSFADAKRAVAMFEKMNVPVLGMIENMSYFICPSCENQHDIFPRGDNPPPIPIIATIPIDASGKKITENINQTVIALCNKIV